MTHDNTIVALPPLHVSDLELSPAAHAYVADCLANGRLTQGEYVRLFEHALAELAGTQYAVACNSGTSALHLALIAAGIGKGDAVILPALTYVATANAVKYVGATPFFVDVRQDDWTIDVNQVNDVARELAERNLYHRIAVIPVHLFDARADISEIEPWLTVIEDSAHTPSLRLHQHSVAAAHSFYASKVICSGEGGAITTNDPIIAERARLYRGQGASTPGKYWHSVIGYNYRMTELQAAIGLAQIEQIADILAKRRAIINRYIDQLPADPLIKPQGGYRTSGWLMAVQLPDLSPTIAIAEKMARDGIETRPFFTPLPALPMYGGFTEDQGGWRVAFAAARRGICLPTHTKMNFADVDLVVDSLERALGAA